MTDSMQTVQGRCPACGASSLFLGDGGHVTCARLECPKPEAADELLHGDFVTKSTNALLTSRMVASAAVYNGVLIRALHAEAELAALRQVARGYCPACGRGDCAPTVEDWEQQKQRADQAEAAHAQTIDSLDRAVRRARRAEAVIEAVAEILADHNGDDWSRHPATEAVASALRLPPTPTAATQATEHVYLSTGCLHGKHDYCRSHTGLSGAKKAAVCKFCQAPCRCSCHQEQPDV